MASNELARVVDPAALDEATGARGRLRIGVPAAWLEPGTRVAIELPRRVTCAGCDGGGCDACDRGGALRTDEAEVEVSLGDCAPPFAVRVMDPCEGVKALVIEIAQADEPSDGVRLVALPAPCEPWVPAASPLASRTPWIVLAVALAALATWALL